MQSDAMDHFSLMDQVLLGSQLHNVQCSKSSCSDSDSCVTFTNDAHTSQFLNISPHTADTQSAPEQSILTYGASKIKSMLFEVDPVIRKRLQTRLTKRIRRLIDEYCIRIGEQAALVTYAARRQQANQTDARRTASILRVNGSQPLEFVLINLRGHINTELQMRLEVQQNLLSTNNFDKNDRTIAATQAEQNQPSTSEIHKNNKYLPPLELDGIPTALDKMTLQQLRAFIPLMMKHSTGNGKPHWGHPHSRPQWWPKQVPWQNVRLDTRSSEEERQKLPWSQALRLVVRECYKFHGREDLLQVTTEVGNASLWKRPLKISGISPDTTPLVLLVQNNNAYNTNVSPPSFINILPANSGGLLKSPANTASNNSVHGSSKAHQTSKRKLTSDYRKASDNIMINNGSASTVVNNKKRSVVKEQPTGVAAPTQYCTENGQEKPITSAINKNNGNVEQRRSFLCHDVTLSSGTTSTVPLNAALDIYGAPQQQQPQLNCMSYYNLTSMSTGSSLCVPFNMTCNTHHTNGILPLTYNSSVHNNNNSIPPSSLYAATAVLASAPAGDLSLLNTSGQLVHVVDNSQHCSSNGQTGEQQSMFLTNFSTNGHNGTASVSSSQL